MSKALLLINTQSRKGRESHAQAVELLQGQGIEVLEPDPAARQDLHQFSDLILQNQDQVSCVVVGGGDGSMHAAINGLVRTQLPLGVLPLGASNNLARNLGIPTALEPACKIIGQGRTEAIDVGWVNGVYFLNVAGIGLSTALRKGTFKAEIRCDGQRHWVRAKQILVCNGKHFGAGMTVSEDASIIDHKLDVCSIVTNRIWGGVRATFAKLRGRPLGKETVLQNIKGREIEIRTEPPLKLDTDGEVTTRTPAYFRVIPNALRVFAPGNS